MRHWQVLKSSSDDAVIQFEYWVPSSRKVTEDDADSELTEEQSGYNEALSNFNSEKHINATVTVQED